MSSVIVYGCIGSILGALFLIVLFRYEGKRGVRFGERLRRHADFFVLKSIHVLHTGVLHGGVSALQQTFHYLFHKILSMVLEAIRHWEGSLRDAIRSNKTIARNAERQTATLSKLEEIALHKVASALTEEEKQAHKEKTLKGL